MKVAYVVGAFPLPSETFVSREVLRLRAMGLGIEVFAARAITAADRDRLTDPVRALADEVHVLGPVESLLGVFPGTASRAARALNARFDREATTHAKSWLRLARGAALARRVVAGAFDRIHAHWPYGSQIAAIAAVLSGRPLSVSVHAHEVGHDGGHFPALFEHTTFAAFCNAAAMAHLIARLPPGAEERCHLLYHGVDLDMFAPLPAPPAPPPLRILSAGRLTKTKGFDRLVRALALLRDRDVDASLTLVGDGSQRQALEALADGLGVRDRLVVTGWVAHDSVREHLARSHVLALLADVDFHDGLPNVVLEAMAVGRPAVVSPLPAAREVVVHGENGFVLSAPDAVEELAAVLAGMAADPSRLAALGRGARARVEAGFDERVHLGRMHALFLKAS